MANCLQDESWKITFFKDKLLLKVFLSLVSVPKSVKQISTENNLHVSSVYRILKKLEQEKLIKKSGAISNGVKKFLYPS